MTVWIKFNWISSVLEIKNINKNIKLKMFQRPLRLIFSLKVWSLKID